MADAEWRLRSVRRHMEPALSRHIAALAAQNPSMDPSGLQSLAVETLHQTGCSYATWLRYETKFERQYDRAYTAWSRYQDVQHRASNQQSSKPQLDFALLQALSLPPSPNIGPSGSNVQKVNAPHPAVSQNPPSEGPRAVSAEERITPPPPPPDSARYGIAQ